MRTPALVICTGIWAEYRKVDYLVHGKKPKLYIFQICANFPELKAHRPGYLSPTRLPIGAGLERPAALLARERPLRRVDDGRVARQQRPRAERVAALRAGERRAPTD